MAAPGRRPADPQGSGIPLDRFRDDAHTLSEAVFEDRHGTAFLVLQAAMLNAPPGPATTEVKLGLDGEAGGSQTVSLKQLVFPVRRSGRSVGHLLTVGRTSNNDVAIRDVSVSRFHAYLKPDDEGRLCIQDAKSTNGTSVNGSSVPPQGAGPPVLLKSGDNLRLGQVELTYIDAPAFQEFVRAYER